MTKEKFNRWKYGILIAVIAIVAIGRIAYFWPKYKSGESAPEFQATLPDGKGFRLSALRNKYVLLHFWGSWCGPCRVENPQLVALYKKYKGDKFDIVSVAIEKDASRWQRALTQDGLTWPYQMMEITPSLRFFDAPIANQFGVKKLPSLFLLRPGGAIILVDPSIEELQHALDAALQ